MVLLLVHWVRRTPQGLRCITYQHTIYTYTISRYVLHSHSLYIKAVSKRKATRAAGSVS